MNFQSECSGSTVREIHSSDSLGRFILLHLFCDEWEFLSLDPKRSNFYLTAAERGRDERLRQTLLQTITAVWDFSRGEDAEMKFKDRVLSCSTFLKTEHQIKFHLQHMHMLGFEGLVYLCCCFYATLALRKTLRPRHDQSYCNCVQQSDKTESDRFRKWLQGNPSATCLYTGVQPVCNQSATSQQPNEWVSSCKEIHHHRLTQINCNVLAIFYKLDFSYWQVFVNPSERQCDCWETGSHHHWPVQSQVVALGSRQVPAAAYSHRMWSKFSTITEPLRFSFEVAAYVFIPLIRVCVTSNFTFSKRCVQNIELLF